MKVGHSTPGYMISRTSAATVADTMKLFKTNNIDVVKTCQEYFNFEMPSTVWTKRSTSFDNKFLSCQNVFVKPHCTLFNTTNI